MRRGRDARRHSSWYILEAALEKLLTEELKLDNAARQKIASQRKIILEGSQEWDILYRKYYNEEVKKLGV